MRVFFALGTSVVLLVGSCQNPGKGEVEPLKTAPLKYFSDHCERCHGENGFNYPAKFAEGMADEDLRKKLVDMCDGPGGKSLDPPDIAAQMAFHRAISDGAPFIAWTGRQGERFEGEVTPDATLSTEPKVEVTIEDGHWSLTLPPAVSLKELVLRAKTKDREAELAFAKAAVSQPRKEGKS